MGFRHLDGEQAAAGDGLDFFPRHGGDAVAVEGPHSGFEFGGKPVDRVDGLGVGPDDVNRFGLDRDREVRKEEKSPW